VPLPLTLGPLTTGSAALASAFRAGKGRQAKTELPTAPAQPVELWSYEGSPFCRVVREQLCELELAHKVITVARGSSKREELVKLAGKFQVPYLVDPNTRTTMFESADINAYLHRTYGSGTAGVPSPAPPATPADETATPAAAHEEPDTEHEDKKEHEGKKEVLFSFFVSHYYSSLLLCLGPPQPISHFLDPFHHMLSSEC